MKEIIKMSVSVTTLQKGTLKGNSRIKKKSQEERNISLQSKVKSIILIPTSNKVQAEKAKAYLESGEALKDMIAPTAMGLD